MKKNGELSKEAQTIFDKISSEYEGITDDPAAVLILTSALEAYDRMRQAQAAIAAHGLVYLDRYGQPKANPAATVERDSRSAMLGALRHLNLDVELSPHAGPGRPPGR